MTCILENRYAATWLGRTDAVARIVNSVVPDQRGLGKIYREQDDGHSSHVIAGSPPMNPGVVKLSPAWHGNVVLLTDGIKLYILNSRPSYFDP
jgi:hypothetical protein